MAKHYWFNALLPDALTYVLMSTGEEVLDQCSGCGIMKIGGFWDITVRCLAEASLEELHVSRFGTCRLPDKTCI
jgi:hypothetical protein